MMQTNKTMLVKALMLIGIFSVLNAAWVFLEIIEYGVPMPSVSDTVMGAVMTYALYKNLRVKVEG